MRACSKCEFGAKAFICHFTHIHTTDVLVIQPFNVLLAMCLIDGFLLLQTCCIFNTLGDNGEQIFGIFLLFKIIFLCV